jgi:CheY-like chemotaxis protein/two-component sensor histidine kinase
LVDGLLDIARAGRGGLELRREQVDLASAVNRAVDAVRPRVESSSHKLEVRLPVEPISLNADPVRLEQILTNLLDNAARYTEPGGLIELSAELDGCEAAIRVRDNGRGIAPELLPRIFDLFVQGPRSLARSEGGLGIGLTQVRNLVKLHGGTIDATSAGLGCGSEFLVHLPLGNVAELSDSNGSHDSLGPQERAAKVLVVDDNKDAADTLATMIRIWGHHAETAYDGPSALMRAQKRPPDVVLMDIGMPVMDGFQAARKMRSLPELADAVLIAVTGYGEDEDRRLARAAGYDHHLLKPVDLDHLEQLLRRDQPAPRSV